jgi:hypothetical protein
LEQYKGVGLVGEIEIGYLFEVIDKNRALITTGLMRRNIVALSRKLCIRVLLCIDFVVIYRYTIIFV